MKNLWIATTPKTPWSEDTFPQGSDWGAEVNLCLTGKSYQVMQDWGGCFNEMSWEALSALDEEPRQAILARLFDSEEGCGFRFGRVPIGASDFALEWYSHNETPGDYSMEHFSIARDHKYLLPFIKAAIKYQPELAVFASPWSPPV